MALEVYKDWLGIAEEIPRPPDHYTLLRLVSFEDDVERIRKNYKTLNTHVRKYATGTYQIESQELLNELAKAMLCLTDPERKRAYDEGLGREFEEEEDASRPTISQTLLKREIATRDQIGEAEQFAERRGLSFRDAVVQFKLVDAETAAEALSLELGLPYVDLDQLTPDDSILARIPRSVARHNTILPLFVDDDMLLVACVDEPTMELEDELRLRIGVPMRRVIASPLAITQAIARYYAGVESDEAAGGSARKKRAPAKKKPRTREEAREESTREHTRYQVGLILLCWSVALPVAMDLFVLDASMSNWLPEFMRPYLLTPWLAPILLLVVWKRFLKK